MTPELAQRVRLRIFEHFLEHASAPVAEQLMNEFGLSRARVAEVLTGLEAARHVALVPGTQRILMAFPFSAVATPFRATARGRSYFANCAWDAVAFHAMLGTDVLVDSFCQHCAAPIHIELSGGHAVVVDPPETIVYLGLRPSEWWADIVNTCSNTMVFFASADHRDISDLCTPADRGASLTPDEAHELGLPLYGHRLDVDYARPTRDELSAHFAHLGLTGTYWTA